MASRGHEIIVRTENYLSSIGKNNSTGKYDRVVRGVKSLLEQGFLEGPELERAIKQEADKLLRKYSLDAKTADKVYDPVLCMMVDVDSTSAKDAAPKQVFGGYEYRGVKISRVLRHGMTYYKVNEKLFGMLKQATEYIDINLGAAKDSKSVIDSIIEEKNGYKYGINNQGTLYLAFPGETENNPHMYLGKDTPENRKNAKTLFDKFKNIRQHDSVSSLDRAIKTMDRISDPEMVVKSFNNMIEDRIRRVNMSDKSSIEACNKDIDKLHMKTLDDLNDLFNEFSNTISKLRREVISKYEEKNKMLFQAYREVDKK